MISIRNREQVEGLVEVDGTSLELVGKESILTAAIGRTGFSWSYRRPASVGSDSDKWSIPIRDHVLIFRLVAVLVLVLPIARRYFNG